MFTASQEWKNGVELRAVAKILVDSLHVTKNAANRAGTGNLRRRNQISRDINAQLISPERNAFP